MKVGTPEIVVWTNDTFENNFGIKLDLTKFLKEIFKLSSDEHFSFKYFTKYAFVKEIAPK